MHEFVTVLLKFSTINHEVSILENEICTEGDQQIRFSRMSPDFRTSFRVEYVNTFATRICICTVEIYVFDIYY